MKTLSSILPWAIVLAVSGGTIWWLLAQEKPAGRWLLAAFLVAHGAVHLLYAVPADTVDGGTDWPFDMGQSWTSTGLGLDSSAIRVVGWTLIAVVITGFLLAALSTVAAGVPTDWWPATLAGSAIASTIVLIIFFTPQLTLGVAINMILVWLSAAGIWTP